MQANNQISKTLSTLPLPGGATSADEANLVDIVTQQQATSLIIQSRYDEFISKLDELLQTIDLSVDSIRKGGGVSSPLSGLSTSPSAVPAKPITGKLNSSLPGIPHKLEWGCDPSELANWFI